jgi:SRSO17 transposase
LSPRTAAKATFALKAGVWFRCPQGTPLAVLVAVEGRRWAIEDAFETTKTELGLAHNETHSWQGWHRQSRW